MGVSRKWFKSIVGKKKSAQTNKVDSKQEPTTPKKSRRWSFLTGCHAIDQGSILGGDDDDQIENGANISGNDCKAPGIVMSPADREEWAAIHIQTASRSFLARRALCALKGLARLQAALSSGHNQSKTSLRSIQTFVRMQARICAHRALKNNGSRAATQRLSTYPVDSQTTETEGHDEWCDAPGSVEEIQARAQQKQEAAIKRDRALAYAFSNQWRANSKLNLESLFDDKLDNSTWSWIWLDRWLSSQPADGRPSNPTPKPDVQAFILKKSASLVVKRSTKTSIDTSKGDHSGLVRAKSHGAGSTLQLSLGSKKQAPKYNAEKSSKQREWRSLSNPKQRLVKEVKRRNSLSNASRKSPSQGANHDQAANKVLAPDEGKKRSK